MIGIFDSGVGGLTVVKQIYKFLPDCPLIYFGDTARLPYGTKGADFVKKYSEKITQWLLDNGAKTIIVACHTSSSLAGDYLKEKFKGVPIIDMITPAARDIVRSNFKKIGVIGTPGTIKSGAWEKALVQANPRIKIYSKACPLFVPLTEEGLVNGRVAEEIATGYLKIFMGRNIEALVLACTHYPILKGAIKKVIGKNVKMIDPAESLIKELSGGEVARLLVGQGPIPFSKNSGHEFFFSDTPYNLKKISNLLLKREIKATIIDPF